MTFSLFIRRYWRIPLVALLAGVLAFGASYVEKPTYKASTRLLLVEGSTTLLNSSGQPANNPYGTDDATSAETMSETTAGLASSRAVATIVVNKLDLAAPKPANHGAIHMVLDAAASAYAHVKAWITSGFYKVPPPREEAIQTTETAINASDLAPSDGPDTGQTDSYILELDANANNPALAARMANTAASALIQVSAQDFAEGSQYYANALSAQLKSADATLSAANRAVASYELAHHISSIDQQLLQSAQNSGTLSAQLVAAKTAVQGDERTVASLQSTLADTNPTESSDQNITTGRSSTAYDTTQANPVYQTLEESLSQAKATEAKDRATVASLQGQTGANTSSALTQAQAGLLDLEQVVTADQDSVQSLSGSLQQAEANVDISPVEITQLGPADTPTYPSSPKRDLYLILGLLLGALAGGWLTYSARRRIPIEPEDDSDPWLSESAEFDYRGEPLQPELVGAHAATNGSATNGSSRRASDNGGEHHNGAGSHSQRASSNGHVDRVDASDLAHRSDEYPLDAENGAAPA